MSGFRHVAYGFALVLCVVLLWTGRSVREEQRECLVLAKTYVLLDAKVSASVDVSSFQKRNNALQDWPTVYSPGHQNPQIAPPLPIQKISNDYIIAQSSTNSTNSTSVFRRLRRGLHASASSTKFNPLFRREVERCSTGSPCADGRSVALTYVHVSEADGTLTVVVDLLVSVVMDQNTVAQGTVPATAMLQPCVDNTARAEPSLVE